MPSAPINAGNTWRPRASSAKLARRTRDRRMGTSPLATLRLDLNWIVAGCWKSSGFVGIHVTNATIHPRIAYIVPDVKRRSKRPTCDWRFNLRQVRRGSSFCHHRLDPPGLRCGCTPPATGPAPQRRVAGAQTEKPQAKSPPLGLTADEEPGARLGTGQTGRCNVQ
jgi:hypothetical protein